MECPNLRFQHRGRCYCEDCNGADVTPRHQIERDADRPPFHPNEERYDWDRTSIADYGPAAQLRLIARGLLIS